MFRTEIPTVTVAAIGAPSRARRRGAPMIDDIRF